MLRLILFSNSSLANCRTKNIELLHSDVGLCRVSNLFLDNLLKTACAGVISELAIVMDDVLAFTDSHFSTVDECPFIEFLCTV